MSAPAPQFRSIYSSALRRIMVQLLHLYIITESIIVLTIGTFAGKLISLFYNMLSSSVVSFLPRSKCLLNSWRQLPSAVILESKKIKSVTASIFSPSICYAVKGPGAMILVFFFFECCVLSQFFHSLLSPSSRGSLVSLHFLH